MKKAAIVMAMSLLAGCNGGGTGAGSGTFTPTALPPPGGTSTPPGTVENLTFTGLLNNVRNVNGAAPIAFDSRLTAAAQGHADDMRANNYFSHTGLNGSDPGDRMRAAGYNWRTYGENIARGQTSEAQVMTAWTNSPGHHANNINPNFEDYGLGKSGTGGQTHWVLVLGAER